VSNSLSLVAAP
jgi:hypothetical protein